MTRRHYRTPSRALQGPRPAPSAAPPSASSPAPPPSAWCRHRLRRPRLDLGRRRPVREQRQLVHQHRQRLLRRPAVLAVDLERLRRPGVRLPGRPGHQGAADRDRREDPGRPGLGRLGLRLRRWRRGLDRALGERLVQLSAERRSSARSRPRAAASRPAVRPEQRQPEHDSQAAPTAAAATSSDAAAPRSSPSSSATPGSAADGTYTVASGDTLSKIAAANGVAGGWEAVYQANADVIPNPDLIFPGQVLRIP